MTFDPLRAVGVLPCFVAPIAWLLALSARADVPRVTMPLMRQTPAIDGRIDEVEWKHAVRHVGFVSRASGAISARPGEFWMGCDGKTLYLAIKTGVAPDGCLLARAVC